jgi:arylsulfatase A-like enzyme
VNLFPFLTGKMTGRPHEALYWRLGENMAIRKGDWKLVKTNERPLQDVDPTIFSDLSGAELYNLANDIGEKKNLAAAHPEKAKELAADWQRWNKELARPLWAPGGRIAGASNPR